MDIYIKPQKKAMITERPWIVVSDVAEVFAEDGLAGRVKNIRLLKTGSDKKSYLISIMDIIKAINNSLPGHTINNVGEIDCIVEFSPQKPKKHSVYKWLKVIFVCVVLFVGSATAIMSFHSDAQMPGVFKNYYKIFLGEVTDDPIYVDLPYSIGLAVGIVVFFNHFIGKKITNDPTPIEVEMSLYESDVTDTKIDVISSAQQEKDGTGEDDVVT